MKKLVAAILALLLVPPSSFGGWIGSGLPVSNDPHVQKLLKLVPDSAGGAVVVFALDGVSGTLDRVLAQRFLEGGVIDPAWPAAGAPLRSVDDEVTSGTYPAAIPDGTGGVIAAWRSDATDQIHVQRIAGTGSVAAGWPLDAQLASLAAGGQTHASVVADGADGAIVTWEDGVSGVYGQRFNGSGARLWPAAGVRISTAFSPGYGNRAVTDGAGGAIVVWPVGNNALFAQRIDGNGNNPWGATPVTVCATAGYYLQYEWFRVASDGAGGAIVVWVDNRRGWATWDIYCQRIAADGSTAWAANGVAVNTDGNETNPGPPPVAVCQDGSGGAYVVWQETSAGGNRRFVVQHLGGDGNVVSGWGPDGIGVTAVDAPQFGLQVASDDQGGAHVAFSDYRSGLSDAYVQHFVAGGVDPAWSRDGVPLSRAAGHQSPVGIAAVGAGDAVACWVSEGGALYLSRVALSGAVSAVPGVGEAGPGRPLLRGNSPNPFNPRTTISFDLPGPANVTLTVYDVSGHVVRVLIDGEGAPAGRTEVVWDGRDGAGRLAPSGVYFYRLDAGGRSETRGMVLVK